MFNSSAGLPFLILFLLTLIFLSLFDVKNLQASTLYILCGFMAINSTLVQIVQRLDSLIKLFEKVINLDNYFDA